MRLIPVKPGEESPSFLSNLTGVDRGHPRPSSLFASYALQPPLRVVLSGVCITATHRVPHVPLILLSILANLSPRTHCRAPHTQRSPPPLPLCKGESFPVTGGRKRGLAGCGDVLKRRTIIVCPSVPTKQRYALATCTKSLMYTQILDIEGQHTTINLEALGPPLYPHAV